MATKTISQYTAVTAGNATGAAVLLCDDVNGNTRKISLATLRTRMWTTSTGFSSDSLTVPNGLTVSANGITVVAGASSFGGSVTATAFISSVAANVAATLQQGAFFTLANNATTTLPGSYVAIYLADASVTANAAFMVTTTGGSAITTVVNGGSLFSNVATTAGKINVYFSAGVLTVENKTGGSVNVRAITFGAG